MADEELIDDGEGGDDAVERLLKLRAGGVDLAVMADAAVDEFGGVQEIMRLIHQEFDNAPDGSMQKLGYMKIVVGLVEEASKRRGNLDAIENLSQEDLAAVIREFVKRDRLQAKLPGPGPAAVEDAQGGLGGTAKHSQVHAASRPAPAPLR